MKINVFPFFFLRFDFLTRNRLHFQSTSFAFCRHILRPDLLIIQYVEFTTLLGQPINQLILFGSVDIGQGQQFAIRFNVAYEKTTIRILKCFDDI